MNSKKTIKIMLITALFFLALGGWLLHLRIHPPVRGPVYFIPFTAGIISAFGLPFLFCFRRTLPFAYVINGFLVIIGTITMTHFSIVHFQGQATAANIILNTLFADIMILWGKFSVGKALFDLEFLRSDTDVAAKGRFFRYPKMGWWWVHLVALSTVYTLGKILWK